MTAETSNARGEWPERYACNGPEGTFWTDDAALANKLIGAAFDRDEWTVTDTQNPTGATPPLPADAEVWMFKGTDGAWHTFLNEQHRLDTIADGRWEVRKFTALPQQQEQAVAECHCATCTCAPGMTPAVRFDLSPAEKEGAIRDHLIALGWTPPGAQQPAAEEQLTYKGVPIGPMQTFADMERQASAPVGVEAIAAEIRASLGRGATVCTRRRWAIELEALAQQPAAVDRARFRKAPCYLCGYNGPGYFQPETHPCAALYHAAQHQEPKS